MTPPLALPSQIDKLSETPAGNLGDRIDLLNSSGHAWMPADMQTTIAAAPLPDTSMLNVANSIKTKLAQDWSGFSDGFDDNILHTQPTASLALARMLRSSLGPIPVAQPHLTEIQTSLVKHGFAKGLPVNGVWDADWNAAYTQWHNSLVQNQLAGAEPGSISIKSAVGFLGNLLNPSKDLNAIVGYAKSLPADVRNLAADTVAGLASVPHALGSAAQGVETGNPRLLTEGLLSATAQAAGPVGLIDSSVNSNQGQVASQLGAEITNLGNHKPMSAAQFEAHHDGSDLIGNVGLLLSLVPVAGAGSAASDILKGSLGKEISLEAAERGPGTIAKSFFGGLTKDEIAGSANPEVALQEGLKGAFANTAERAPLRNYGIAGSRVFNTIPGIRNVVPAVGRLADADGLYYQARTFAALPYMYPAVRAAGAIGQRAVLLGATLQAGAAASQAIAGPTATTDSILHGTWTNDVDRALDRVIGTPGEKPFTDAVNAAGLLLHGPLGDNSVSTAIGDHVQATQDVMTNIQGNQPLNVHWEDALHDLTGNRDNTYDSLVAKSGSKLKANMFLTSMIRQIGVDSLASTLTKNETGLEPGLEGWGEAYGANRARIWDDPQMVGEAQRKIIARPEDLKTGIMKNAQDNGLLSSSDDYVTNFNNWMDQTLAQTDMIRSGKAAEFFGGHGQAAIREAQDSLDMGLHSGSTFPTITGTRRQYVQDVQNLTRKVSRGVDKARTVLSDNLTDAGDDPNSQRLAQVRQQRFEQAVGDSDMVRATEIVRDLNITRTKATDQEWTQLAKDSQRLRQLIATSGHHYDLPSILSDGVDPDELYTAANGAPIPADGAEPGSNAWVQAHLNQDGGSFGFMRNDGKTIQNVTKDLRGMVAAADSAGNQEAYQAAILDMQNYAYEHLGQDRRALGLWDNADQLAERIQTLAAGRVASDAFLAHDASPEAKAFVAESAARGFKPVFGNHIFHVDGSYPPLDDIEGSRRYGNSLWKNLGFSTRPTSQETYGGRLAVLRQAHMQRVLSRDDVTPITRGDASTALNVIYDKGLLKRRLPPIQHYGFRAAQSIGLHNPQIRKVMETEGLDRDAAVTAYEQDMADGLGLTQINKKQLVKAWTTPGEGHNADGVPWQWDGVSERTANLFVQALRDAQADIGPGIVGLQSVENHFKNGFGLAGKLVHVLPDSGAINAFAAAPNELINLRNDLRFALSPLFDLRRIAKTNYKMALDHVRAVFDPLSKMTREGTYNDAHELLNTLIGEPKEQAGFQEADLYNHGQSILGKFNQRQFKAYYAWARHTDGASDDEIRTGLRTVFDYGSTRAEGRTPLESTLNTVFFPFSFLKTLYRNTGMYALDHVQQAILATAVMSAYEHANKNNMVTSWVDDHLPLVEEMNKLNAFSHGLSLGQVGGINAPLLNLFLPQAYGEHYTKSNLSNTIPVWKDFAEVFSASREQAVIGRNATQNAISYAVHLGAPREPFDPYKPTVTPDAQFLLAAKKRNELISAMSIPLDHNVHAGPQDKIRWPDEIKNPDGSMTALPKQIQGQPIDRTTIGWLVHRWYPAYSPDFSQQYAQKQETAATVAINGLSDPKQRAEWGAAVKLTASYSEKLDKDEYDTADAVAISNQFRDIAVHAAETEPGFLAFYQSHLQYVWGPITTVDGE